MTLNELINSLTWLQNKYNAADFEVCIDKIESAVDPLDGLVYNKTLAPMDGDNYHLDLVNERLEFNCD